MWAHRRDDDCSFSSDLVVLQDKVREAFCPTAGNVVATTLNVLATFFSASRAESSHMKLQMDATKRELELHHVERSNDEVMKEMNLDLSHTKTELGQTKTELGQTKTELGQTKTELGQTKTELGQTKTELGQTKIELGQTKTELGQTKTELGQTKTELGKAKILCEKLGADVCHLHAQQVAQQRKWRKAEVMRARQMSTMTAMMRAHRNALSRQMQEHALAQARRAAESEERLKNDTKKRQAALVRVGSEKRLKALEEQSAKKLTDAIEKKLAKVHLASTSVVDGELLKACEKRIAEMEQKLRNEVQICSEFFQNDTSSSQNQNDTSSIQNQNDSQRPCQNDPCQNDTMRPTRMMTEASIGNFSYLYFMSISVY